MTEQEQSDLVKLKEEVKKLKLSSFDFMLHCLRNGVENSGFKTVADAVMYSLKYCQKQIDKLTQSHIKKYPD